MSKKASLVVALLSAFALAMPLGLAEGNKVTLTGHLIDQMCGAGIKDVAKAQEHTRECALMDSCASSGYGIVADGKFVKFDAEGSKKAKALVENSTKEKDIQVTAEGTLEGDLLTLTSIQEK